MIIVEVTGPPGSGKSTLMQHAAAGFGKQIHSAPSLTRHAVHTIMIDASAEPEYAKRIVFFDEVDRSYALQTDTFRAYLEKRYSDLPVRVVLIGEIL